jgi:hypothetical protein
MSETAHHPDCKCFVIISGKDRLAIGCRQRIRIPTTVSTVLGMQPHGEIKRTDIVKQVLPAS